MSEGKKISFSLSSKQMLVSEVIKKIIQAFGSWIDETEIDVDAVVDSMGRISSVKATSKHFFITIDGALGSGIWMNGLLLHKIFPPGSSRYAMEAFQFSLDKDYDGFFDPVRVPKGETQKLTTKRIGVIGGERIVKEVQAPSQK